MCSRWPQWAGCWLNFWSADSRSSPHQRQITIDDRCVVRDLNRRSDPTGSAEPIRPLSDQLVTDLAQFGRKVCVDTGRLSDVPGVSQRIPLHVGHEGGHVHPPEPVLVLSLHHPGSAERRQHRFPRSFPSGKRIGRRFDFDRSVPLAGSGDPSEGVEHRALMGHDIARRLALTGRIVVPGRRRHLPADGIEGVDGLDEVAKLSMHGR